MIILLFSAFHKLSYTSLLSYTFIALFFSITFLVYVMTEYDICLCLGFRGAPISGTLAMLASSPSLSLASQLLSTYLWAFSHSFRIKSSKQSSLLTTQDTQNSWGQANPKHKSSPVTPTTLTISTVTRTTRGMQRKSKVLFKHFKVRESK